MNEPTVLVWLLVEQDGAVLVAQRKADRPPFAGRWVLPGDLLRERESSSETIVRVGRSELDIQTSGEEFIDTIALDDGDRSYVINVFRVLSFTGHPRFRESGPYGEVGWAPMADVREGRGIDLPQELRNALSAAERRMA